MNYKVLYRKYRPENFDDIIGQDYIIQTLKNSIKNQNIAHAYIFSGPRGTGKTTTAKVFAKAINCVNPVDASPCGKCDFCVHFQDNPDIIEIDAASNNGVDEIRGLIENIKLTPTNGRYKVYIIDEVHMLTTSAFNALLLTLEEPPAHSIFILATTNIESVPITILSRCQRFDFQKIKIDDMIKRMAEICAREELIIDERALKEIAYLAEGGMRDALSLLDQLSKSKDKITLELIEKQFKTISKKTIDDMFEYLEENNIDECLKFINQLRNRAVDYKTLVKKMIDNASVKARNIILTNQIKRLNFNDYKNLILELVDSLNRININVDSYTIFEMILLNYFIKTSENNKNNAIEKELENEENVTKNMELSAPKTKEQNNIEDLINLRINNCFANAQKKNLEEFKIKIDELSTAPKTPGKIKGILVDSILVAASDKNLIFTVNNEHNEENANKMLNEIENCLNNELNNDCKIIFLTEKRWQIEKEKYIKNIKDKKVYEYIEEPKQEKKEEIINDVFDLSKVEII